MRRPPLLTILGFSTGDRCGRRRADGQGYFTPPVVLDKCVLGRFGRPSTSSGSHIASNSRCIAASALMRCIVREIKRFFRVASVSNSSGEYPT